MENRYALCIGIGKYTKLLNNDLRFATADAKAVAERLGDPLRGNFSVTLLTEPNQTTKPVLDIALDKILNAPELNAEDLVVIYLACHGDVYGKGNVFYFQPSDAEVETDGMPKKTTVIDIHGLATYLSEARVKNIVFLLDVCHSGGAGIVLEHLNLNLNPDTNLLIIGAARQDQITAQSSTLQHGIFTNCLLQAFEQKPHRNDGWLTISDTLSFVSEAIKVETSKLSKQEGPIQIQARSALVNPNLPFVKNPLYSPQNLDFHEAVKKLLELVHYEPVQTVIPSGAPVGFYVAETKAGLRTHRVGIISYYNQVEPLTFERLEKIALFFQKQVEQNNLNEGLVVTALEVSHEIRETLQKSGIQSLDMHTYESIRKQLINFNKHLQKLVNAYRTVTPEHHDDPPLEKIYIPLRIKHRYYPYPSDETKEDLEQEVKCWLSDPSTTRLAILADYGSGKSTFCQHFAATLAQNYLMAQEHERYQQRIPLLIPLGDFSKSPVDFNIYLVSYLKHYCQVNNPDVEALMKMAEAGLLLFLLDGFDEMAARATNDTVAMNIEQFERLASIPQNKVLLTTRPEYFMTHEQEQEVLHLYPCLDLQAFNEEQVNLYLQKRVPFLKSHENKSIRDWTYYRQRIDEIHDLSDLVRRPVLLEMIVKTLPVLIAAGEAVNRPNLYQRYLEGELERQIRKQRRDLRIKREKRFEIMENIAIELYKTNRIALRSRDILKISEELLTLEQQEEMEGSLREIVTCSFLIRTENEYRFSHQSFLEYLVARHLAKDILENISKNFQHKSFTRAIRDFLLEMDDRVIQRNFVTEMDTGVVLKSSVIVDANDIIISIKQETLKGWFRLNPKIEHLGGNILSLLKNFLQPGQLQELPLAGANLEEADLSRADLSGADLHGANLSRADLSGADLHGANLSRADLSGANLYKANLSGVNLRGASLYRTNLYGMNLSKINLSKADLDEANLSKANLSKANLSEAKLKQTDLTRADLRGADLSGADLRRADLSGADLRRADLIRSNLYEAKLDEGALEDKVLNGAILEESLDDALLEEQLLNNIISEELPN